MTYHNLFLWDSLGRTKFQPIGGLNLADQRSTDFLSGITFLIFWHTILQLKRGCRFEQKSQDMHHFHV